MKCLVMGCSNEIDELKEIPAKYGPGGVNLTEGEQRAHSAELERWAFIVISRRGATDVEIASGHVCPDHRNATFALAAGKEV